MVVDMDTVGAMLKGGGRDEKEHTVTSLKKRRRIEKETKETVA